MWPVVENVWDGESADVLRRLGAADVLSRVISLVNFRNESARVTYAESLFSANKTLVRRGLPWLNSPRTLLEDYQRAAARGLLPPNEKRLRFTLERQQKEFQDGLSP